MSIVVLSADCLHPIGGFLHRQHIDEDRAWLSKRLHQPKHEGLRKLLLEIQKLQRKHPEVQVIAAWNAVGVGQDIDRILELG